MVHARLEYPLPHEPPTLTISAPAGETPASVGFVVYDRGIAVNDFRYLGRQYTLLLDWEDPWYTRFQSRNLRRRYFAPMSGFVYVEPYEVRKEIVVRPGTSNTGSTWGSQGARRSPSRCSRSSCAGWRRS